MGWVILHCGISNLRKHIKSFRHLAQEIPNNDCLAGSSWYNDLPSLFDTFVDRLCSGGLHIFDNLETTAATVIKQVPVILTQPVSCEAPQIWTGGGCICISHY